MNPSTASTKPTVLVVEDDPLLRMMAVDMIEEAGFDVLEACDADSAIVLLESRLDIRIVFTDIDMPGGMDGMKLAACIRDRWPPIEIVLTSGRITPVDAELPERGVFIPKPFTQADLAATLWRVAA